MVPPQHPPPVWCGGGLLPSPPVVWCGVGVGFGGSPPSPPVAWCGLGGSPLHVWICLGCWQTHAHDDIDVDDDEDSHDHHYHNHLSVSLVGRRVSSAHVPADDYRFIDRGGTIFVTVVALGQSE